MEGHYLWDRWKGDGRCGRQGHRRGGPKSWRDQRGLVGMRGHKNHKLRREKGGPALSASPSFVLSPCLVLIAASCPPDLWGHFSLYNLCCRTFLSKDIHFFPHQSSVALLASYLWLGLTLNQGGWLILSFLDWLTALLSGIAFSWLLRLNLSPPGRSGFAVMMDVCRACRSTCLQSAHAWLQPRHQAPDSKALGQAVAVLRSV